MSLYFKTIRSSSKANCLAMWTESTRVLFDCGFSSMKQTREALNNELGSPEDIDAVIVSHLHGDHIRHYPLRVIEEFGLPIRVHQNCLKQLAAKHYNGRDFRSLRLEPFEDKKFEIGDLVIEPFRVPHHPEYLTHGFVVKHFCRGKWIKAVMVTDFNSAGNSLENFVEADFIFVESNHDLELLRMNFNPNSRYHMSNPKTAQLLCKARKLSKKPPQSVMLGHLSDQRNETKIALQETRNLFSCQGVDMDFALHAAPLFNSSGVVRIG